tara:strand:+ start:136 stop:354 length:219 start_codon:yes stop_codon:yes gene_type:complete
VLVLSGLKVMLRTTLRCIALEPRSIMREERGKPIDRFNGSGVKYQKAGDMELIIIIVIVAIAIFGTWAMLDG